MEREVAKLFLSSGFLTTTQTSIGIRNSANTEFTWNVDMRNVLGETLWTKYDNYKVYIQIQQNPSAVNELQTAFIQGLNFRMTSNQGQLQTNKFAIASFFHNTNSPATEPVINGFIMIKPNTNLVPITVTFESNDGTTPTATSPLLAVILTFVPLLQDKIISPYNTCFQNEQSNFSLSTQILTASSTNQYGTMNTNKSVFTFTNLNMRQVIGTLWDKYDKFNLQIRSLGVGATASSYSSNQRRLFFEISGLQFINNMIIDNTVNLSNVWTQMFYIESPNISSAISLDSPTDIYTFRKPESENINLSFTLWTVNSLISPYTGILMGDWTFTFSVFGVK